MMQISHITECFVMSRHEEITFHVKDLCYFKEESLD